MDSFKWWKVCFFRFPLDKAKLPGRLRWEIIAQHYNIYYT